MAEKKHKITKFTKVTRICVVGLVYENQIRNELQKFIDEDSNKLDPSIVTRATRMLQTASMTHADDLYKILDEVNPSLVNKVRRILLLDSEYNDNKSQQDLIDMIMDTIMNKL